MKSQIFFSLLAAGFTAGSALLDPSAQKIDAKHPLSVEKQNVDFMVDYRRARERLRVNGGPLEQLMAAQAGQIGRS